MMTPKNLVSLALSVALTSQIVWGFSAKVFAADYPDIQGSWAQTDLQQFADQNILKPYSDGQLHPEAWVTRSDLRDILKKSLGLSEGQLKNYQSYQKMSTGMWPAPKVEASAAGEGEPTKYHPANAIHRVEVMALLGEMYGNLPSEEEANQTLSRFTDQDQIPAGLRPAVAKAVQTNLAAFDPAMSQSDTLLAPTTPATRADTAVMVNHFIERASMATNLPANRKVAKNALKANKSSESEAGSSAAAAEASANASGKHTQEMKDTGSAASTAGTTDNLSASESSSVTSSETTASDNSSTMRTSQTQTSTTTEAAASTAGGTVMVPAQTILTGVVANTIYSNASKVGDKVTVILDHPFVTTDGSVAVPAGSRLIGTVQEVERYHPTAPAKPGMVSIHFTQLETPSHVVIPISAALSTPDGKLYGDSTTGFLPQPNSSYKDVEAQLKTVLSALPDSEQGRGYLFREGVQDTPNKLVDKQDKQVVVGVGDILQVRIDQPISVTLPPARP